MRRSPFPIAALLVVLAIFYALAVSRDVYEATTPAGIPWHVLLRKVYSVIAFALIGGTAIWALRIRSAWPYVFGVAAYSGAIEVGQYVAGAREGLDWNAFDVACGALGGALAATIRARRGTERT